MKKVFVLFAAAAMIFASCAKIEEGSPVKDGGASNFTVTATIDQTRVSFAEETKESKTTLKAAWDESDEIFGFDDKGNKLTFEVASITEGVATFSLKEGTPASDATKLYLMYYPGKTTADIADNTLAVDLSAQTNGDPDATLPAVMLATGTISGKRAALTFSNECAIVAIKGMSVVAGVSKLNSVKVGNIITAGTISVSEGNLVLTPSSEMAPATITNSTGWAVTSATGEVDEDIYFAALPNADAQAIGLTATLSSKEYTWQMTGTTAIAKGTYYRINNKSVTTGAVAEIGAVKYATIAAAFTAANASNDPITIKLLADCVPTGYLNISTGGTGEVTLDLNGKNLSFTSHRLTVAQKRTLNIIDSYSDDVTLQGTISTTSLKTQVILVSSSSVVNIYGGNIATPDDATSQSTIQVQTGGTLNIHGGKISSSSFNNGAVLITSSASNAVSTVNMDGGEVCCSNTVVRITNSNANLSGGKITCTGAETTSAVLISNSKENEYGCSVTLSGTLDVTSTSYYAVRAYSGGTVNIIGGSYHSARYPANAYQGTLKVSGGTFLNGTGYVTAFQSTTTGRIEIKGGKWMSNGNIIGKSGDVINSEVTGGVFNKIPGDDYIPTGYHVEANSDFATLSEGYKYCVVAGSETKAAKIGETEYDTVDDAFADANKAGTTSEIVLLKNSLIATKTELVSSADVTLDLNGKTLVGNGLIRVNVGQGANYTIKDSKGGGSYVNMTTGNSPTITVYGTLTLESGDILNNGTNPAVNISGGIFTMNGGSLYCCKNYGLMVTEEGSATIKGGSIQSDENYAIYFNKNSNVTVGGGTIESTSRYAIYSYASTLTITGGSIQSDEKSAVCLDQASTMTVGGGTIESLSSCAIYNSASTLTITDGTFTSGGSTVYLANPVACTISGGSFLCNNTGTASANIRAVYYGSSTTTQGNLEITGGYFYTKGTAKSSMYAIFRASKDYPLSISGGYYNTTLADAYIATNYAKYIKTPAESHSHGAETLSYGYLVKAK